MSVNVYPKALEGALSGAIDLPGSTVKVAFLDGTYAYAGTHEFVSDLGASIVARSAALASKTVTGGVFDAADTSAAGVAAGSDIVAWVTFIDTGSDATSRLLSFHDRDGGGSVFDVPTNGSDIDLTFNASGIFSI